MNSALLHPSVGRFLVPIIMDQIFSDSSLLSRIYDSRMVKHFVSTILDVDMASDRILEFFLRFAT